MSSESDNRPICKKHKRSSSTATMPRSSRISTTPSTCTSSACKIVPDNLVYRQALRGIERRKFNNDPGKVGMLVGAKNQPILMRAKSARSKGKFAAAIELCEDAFVNNPWDVGAARVAAEAAEGLGSWSLAQWFVESVQAVTKDVDFLKFAARIHEANESWQKAIGCWEQVKKLNPNDQDANRQINALSAARTIKRAGLDDALDERAAAAAAAEPAESMRGQARAAQARAAHARAAPGQGDPGRPDGRPRLPRAGRHLSPPQRPRQGREGAGQGPQGQSRRPGAGVDLRGHPDQPPEDGRSTASQQRVLQHPEDTGAKVKLDQLTEMLNKYEVEAFRRRVKLHPEDAKRASSSSA